MVTPSSKSTDSELLNNAIVRPLTATLDTSGFMMMIFDGDITPETIDIYKKELDRAANLIEQFFKAHTRKVKVLLDIQHFKGKYNVDALTALVSFAKRNTPYVDRTASFGGSDTVRMIGEVAIALSGRENIKICNTKEEALIWVGK